MLIKLIIKNLKVGYTKFISGIILNAFLAGGFVLSYYDWEVFMMLGYLTISFHASFFIDIERRNGNEIFSLSLPCTRSSMIVSRYLTVFLIAIIGFIIWYSAAFVWDLILYDGHYVMQKILTPKVGLMATVFLVVNQSIYLPSTFKLEPIYMRIIFGIGLVISVFIIANAFGPYRATYNPTLTERDIPLIISFFLILTIMLLVSYNLSQKFYMHHDL